MYGVNLYFNGDVDQVFFIGIIVCTLLLLNFTNDKSRNNVFKRLVLQTCKHQGLFWERDNSEISLIFLILKRLKKRLTLPVHGPVA